MQPGFVLVSEGVKRFKGIDYHWKDFMTGDETTRFVVVQMPDGFLREKFYNPFRIELKQVLEELML